MQRFRRFAIKVSVTGLIFLSSIQPVVSQTTNQGNYLSIDQVIDQLEHKYPIQFFYESEWFENKSFPASILKLSFGEALNRIQTTSELSVITIDSVLFVFIPVKPIIKLPTRQVKSDAVIVGNPDDYGKYSKATFHGKILDGKNGNPLSGASIFIDKLKLGARTDEKGNYHLQAPVGEHTIRLSFIGYDDNLQKIKLVSDGTLNLELFEKSIKLGEVIIYSERSESNVSRTQMSIIKLDVKAIKELPVSLGGTDIIKSITLMPGVQTIGEFGTGFNVRGGNADQNLILIEDVPLFNLSHLFGLISVVNSDGISDVTLLKAGISAKYGERASSVMDIRMGASNPDKTKVKGGIGIINSTIYVETPLIDKKIGLLIGARSSYSNWLLHSIPDIDLMNSSAHFYDANALLSFNLNTKNKINVFAYISNDKFGFAKNTDYQYNNLLASIRWKHSFNNNLYFNLSAGISDYRFYVSESDTSRQWEAYSISSALLYRNIKWNFSWFPNENHALDFGINAALYNIQPGKLNGLFNESIITPIQMQPKKAIESAFYLTDNITISSKLALDLGVRYSLYSYLGPNKVYIYQSNLSRTPERIVDSLTYSNNKPICWYSGLEPRLSLRFTISTNSSVKLSYNRIHQYVNLVSNTAVMAPSDVWKLSSPNLKPLTCDHFAIGYFRNFKNNTYETSIEFYYKNLMNAIEYKNGARILLNPYLEADLTNVRGNNYGVELYVKKNAGRLTGWASYTFSRSLQKTTGIFTEDKINDNQPFPSNFDRPNNLILNANYHISKRWRFNGTFTYSTGRPVTLPELKFGYQGYQLLYYSDRNKYRLPDYHRLDVSITLDESLKIKKRWKGSWTFSIINLYGRKNAYSVFYKKEGHLISNEYRQYDTYMLYIIGRPLPMLTYNFTF
ncbi:MAG: TonB-dependent receptor [Bacteroidia bacterium]|nr:TonB-dependent receptor [Bacteroidia bacterium]